LAFVGLHPDRCADLVQDHGSVERVIRAIAAGAAGPEARRALRDDDWCRSELDRHGIAFDLVGDPALPDRLAAVERSPRWLFRVGPPVSEAGVAIVGTRRCTAYGRRLASAFGEACAARNWPVVSGLARGIDGAAHEGALAGGGLTVAVVGAGLDVRYPREHVRLHERILDEGGTILSEYPPASRPFGWRFPPRNRIISGLAAAVVVVESAVTGGSLGTAAHAVAQDRVVFAVPGDVDREASVGCNLLIRDGAIPVLGASDLVEGLSLIDALGR
jgi:DNA processing protein